MQLSLTQFDSDILSCIVQNLSYPEVLRLVMSCRYMRKTLSCSDVEQAKQRTKERLGKIEIVGMNNSIRISDIEGKQSLVIGKSVGIGNPDYITVEYNGTQLVLSVPRAGCGRRPAHILLDLVKFTETGIEAKAWFDVTGLWITVQFYSPEIATARRRSSFEHPFEFTFKFEEQNLLQ